MTVVRAAALAVAALALTSCTSSLTTSITVTSPTAATVHVSAVFTDEVAHQITADAAARSQLLGVFSDRTGHAPSYTVSHGGNQVEVSDDLTYQQLRDSSDVTGVSDVSLSGSGSHVVAAFTLTPPTKIITAVTTSEAGQPDGAALTATMLRSTSVTVSVRFPGGVSSTTGGVRHGDTVTFTRTAADTSAAHASVAGNPTPSHWQRYGAIGAGLALAAAALAWRRRRTATSTAR